MLLAVTACNLEVCLVLWFVKSTKVSWLSWLTIALSYASHISTYVPSITSLFALIMSINSSNSYLRCIIIQVKSSPDQQLRERLKLYLTNLIVRDYLLGNHQYRRECWAQLLEGQRVEYLEAGWFESWNQEEGSKGRGTAVPLLYWWVALQHSPIGFCSWPR